MGYIHIYTGNAKGKTTCAVGLTVRALGAGMRVAFCQFDKGFEGKNEHYHERFILRILPNLDLFFFGEERMMPDGKFRFPNNDADFRQAAQGLAKARELVGQNKYDMIVLDEIVTCILTKLLQPADLLDLISFYRTTAQSAPELVLTGRGAFPELIEQADLVTEMTLIKHYWYEGNIPPRKGIDF
jgi:cob(I)alamin adenosyltransferase